MGAQLDALLVKLASGGTPWKRAVDVATTANIALTGLQTIDGVTVAAGERVLCQDQTAPAQNGVYVAAAGTWTRAADMDRDSYAQLGTVVRVMRGTANGGKLFYISSPTSGDIRIGSTSTTWAEFATGGGSGTVAATPGTVAQRDAAGELYATSFQGGATGSTVVASVGATSDITLDSARDVIVDHATGRSTLLKENGVTFGTLSSAAGSSIDANGTTLDLGSNDPGIAALTVDDSASIIAGTLALVEAPTVRLSNGTSFATCTDSSGTFLCATSAPMRIQPQQATSGNGRSIEVSVGEGQTPGTSTPGNYTIDLGTAVGGAIGGKINIRDATNTRRLDLYTNNSAGLAYVESTNATGLAVQSASLISIVSASYILLRSPGAGAGGMYIDATDINYRNGAGTVTTGAQRGGSATIGSATTTNVATFATTANRVYQCVGHLTVSNDTDDQGAAYMVRAAFKNVAGTVTQIGSTQTIAADLEDAGQTGLSAVLDFSGTDLRLRLVTDAADTVNVNGKLEILERVLA